MDKADVIRKVQALLERAESSGFTAEADACRKKADEMMMAYSLSQWEVDQRRSKEQRQTPEVRDIHIAGADSQVRDNLVSLLGIVTQHLEVRAVVYGLYNKRSPISAKVVGYPAELDYCEMLYTSLRVQMEANLVPKIDPKMSFEENLALLKEAGMKWADIHQILDPDTPFTRNIGVRYTKMYTDFCLENDRERMYTSPVTYQRNFAEGFINKVSIRLHDIRAHRRANEQSSGSGMEIMLRDKRKDINDFYKDMFGHTSPISKKGPGKFDNSAYSRGSEAGSRADLGQTRVGQGSRAIEG